MFLKADNHFVRQVINHFQAEFDKAMRHTLDKHFSSIETLLDDFVTAIRAQGPIVYKMTHEGETVRGEVERHIPKLQKKIDELAALLPARVSQEENGQGIQIDTVDAKDEDEDLTVIYERIRKRKEPEQHAGRPRNKRIKQEPT